MIFPNPLIILAAILLDLLVGDPSRLYHPVRIIGQIIKYLSAKSRQLFPTKLYLAGVIVTLITTVLTTSAVATLLFISFKISFLLGLTMQVVFISLALSTNSLAKEGRKTKKYLSNGQSKIARKQTQNLVSRDLSKANDNDIIRALLESLTENTNDGIIAPLFYTFLGGAIGIWFYKAINTLDSMIGYKDEHYLEFGKFAARFDDLLNCIPARITGMLMILLSFLLRHNYRQAIKSWLKDSQKGPSPNGGIPIVVFAGSLNIALGGNCYNKNGQKIEIPTVGGQRQKLNPNDIQSAIIYIYGVTFLFVIFIILLELFLLSFLN